MSESLQTRTEHSRSLEDAEKFQAIQTLTELGLLVSLAEVELWHGRAGTKDEQEEWAVDPSFANGSNDSGNLNVNNRPTLYTDEESVARDFAVERMRDRIGPKYDRVFSERVKNYTPEQRQEWFEREKQRVQKAWDNAGEGGRDFLHDPDTYSPRDMHTWSEERRLKQEMPEEERRALLASLSEGIRGELHEIITADSDATVLDLEFDASKLEEADSARYKEALRILARQTPITEGSPVRFGDRHSVASITEAIKKRKRLLLFSSEIDEITQETGADEQVVLQIVSGYNALNYARIKPAYLAHRLIKHAEDIFVDNLEIEGKKEELPINLEYVQRYLRNAHIVGVRQRVSSATLNRSITPVSFFDLEKTNTKRTLAAERVATWQRLGSMTTVLGGVIEDSRNVSEKPLLNILTDMHAKPQALVELASQVEGYDHIFNADAGNWEGFTLAEHTETVLRNFDENYADKLPVELIAPMRLAILAHDLGKPQAVSEGTKHQEKEHNIIQAGDFLAKLGISEEAKNLTLAIIGDGAQLAYQINIRGDRDRAKVAMKELARRTLQPLHSDGELVSEAEVEAFSEMCTMLQVCDGGAYTSMAITRSKTVGARYRNAPSFNRSFSQPLGLGKRTIKLRSVDEEPAAHDLTPKSS